MNDDMDNEDHLAAEVDATDSAPEQEPRLERRKRRSVAGRRKSRRKPARNSWSEWGEEVVADEDIFGGGGFDTIWEEPPDSHSFEQPHLHGQPSSSPPPVAFERSMARTLSSAVGHSEEPPTVAFERSMARTLSSAVGHSEEPPAAVMPRRLQTQLQSVSDDLSRLLLALQPQVVATRKLETELCTLQAQIQHHLREDGDEALHPVHATQTNPVAASSSRAPERFKVDLAVQNLPSVSPKKTSLHPVHPSFSLPKTIARQHTGLQGHDGPPADRSTTARPHSWRGGLFRRAHISAVHRATRQPLLPDTDDMKRAVREAATKQTYCVRQRYKTTGLRQQIARSEVFDLFTMVFIIASSLWISIEADHNQADLLLHADPGFIVVENLFCSFFTFEWLIRFGAFERKIDAFHDRWFCLDSLMLAFMVFDTWLLLLASLLFGDALPGGFNDASFLRLVRLLRLCRVVRLTKILCAMPELMVLFKGLTVAFRAVVATLGLLAVVIYIFAILFRQLARGTDLEETFFSSIPNSMAILLITSVTPDLVDYYTTDFAGEHFFLGCLFFCFIMLVTFLVLNLLVGVLVNVVAVVANVEKEEVQVGALKKQIASMFELLDEDSDCMVSRAEFNSLLVRPELCAALSEAGVDCVGLVDVAQYIFDQHNGEVEVGMLLDLVLQLRGTNNATVKDIVDFRRLLSHEFHKLEDRILSFARAVAIATRAK